MGLAVYENRMVFERADRHSHQSSLQRFHAAPTAKVKSYAVDVEGPSEMESRIEVNSSISSHDLGFSKFVADRAFDTFWWTK